MGLPYIMIGLIGKGAYLVVLRYLANKFNYFCSLNSAVGKKLLEINDLLATKPEDVAQKLLLLRTDIAAARRHSHLFVTIVGTIKI